MKTTFLRNAASRPAFTLVEIITVIAIIMALAAMTIGGLSFAQKKAQLGRSTVFVASVGQALEQYRADNGVFPYGDGLDDSTELVYAALSGDGVGDDGIAGNGDQNEIVDGEPDLGAQVYLGTLNGPEFNDPKYDKLVLSKQYNIRKSGSGLVIVDPWKEQGGAQRQELFYRHDPSGNDSSMMNPPSDFDLWSLGPIDKEDNDLSEKEKRTNYIKNW